MVFFLRTLLYMVRSSYWHVLFSTYLAQFTGTDLDTHTEAETLEQTPFNLLRPIIGTSYPEKLKSKHWNSKRKRQANDKYP